MISMILYPTRYEGGMAGICNYHEDVYDIYDIVSDQV